jgi:cytochrome c-type biogenesis protein CcmF
MQLSAGGFIAHLGLAVTLAGLILSRGLERKQQEIIQSGGSAQMLDYKVNFNKVDWKDEFDREGKVVFDVDGPGNEDFSATPGLYYYEQNGELKPQVWPFVKSYPTHDVYFSLHPPVTEVWEKPQAFKPGETRTIDGVTVTYVKATREGTPGQAGAKFGGEFLIKSRDGQHRVSPYMELMAGGGPQTSFTPVGKDFLATIAGMDAATKTVQLSLLFQRPLYPLEVFTKPLTSLVWLGTGILFLGGMMSAVARRRRVQTTESVPQTENLTHAPLPASQG